MLMVVSLHDRNCAVATLIRLKVLLELTMAEFTSSVRYLQSRRTCPPSHAASSSLRIQRSSHELVMACPSAASRATWIVMRSCHSCSSFSLMSFWLLYFSINGEMIFCKISRATTEQITSRGSTISVFCNYLRTREIEL